MPSFNPKGALSDSISVVKPNSYSFKESSFQESTDYIYWDKVNAIDGTSITYFYSKKKSMLIVTEFGFESKDYFGRQGNIYKDIFKCFI